MFLYGASGHAKVIIEILERRQEKVQGLFDDNPSISHLLQYKVTQYPGEFNKENDYMIISIGNNLTRKKIRSSLKVNYSNAIHPNAIISVRVSVGDGTVVMAGSTINSSTSIGEHCIINTNASIDHDCLISDFVHISPNVTVCGDVYIGEGTHIGAGAVIIQGVRIGKWCTVGAGAVVIKDIPDYSTAVGNPSKIIKIINPIHDY